MLFVIVRLLPTVVIGPVIVRLRTVGSTNAGAVAAKNPALRVTLFAIVMSLPAGWMIGDVAPEMLTAPVPNGPAVTEPGAPTVLAPTRTMGCTDVGTLILLPPEKVCWAFVTNVPDMVLVRAPVPPITPLRLAVPAPLTVMLPLLATDPLRLTVPALSTARLLLLVTSEPIVSAAMVLLLVILNAPKALILA